MAKEIDFFHLDSEDAKLTSYEMEKRLGITVSPLVLGQSSNIDPLKGFVVFNGDGYLHHYTRRVVKDLLDKRRRYNLPAFSYVHIDGHDDMAALYEGDDDSYKSFVLGIIKDTDGHIFFLEEGLTGERSKSIRFLTPHPNPAILDWGPAILKLQRKHAYVSIDFDVLDPGAGIHHLFPQSPTGFDMPRLTWNLEQLGRDYSFVGVDMVGFSTKGASTKYVNESLENIARVTDTIVNMMSR